MLTFPSSTRVGRSMPKEAFYRNLTLSADLKAKFVADVQRIVLEYKLAPSTLNVPDGTIVHEILVLAVELKRQAFDARIIENIARQNAHKLLFWLRYGDQAQLALYHAKLYRTDWMPAAAITLSAQGQTLDDVWDRFIAQIALREASPMAAADASMSIDARITRQETIARLQKEIDSLERATQKEVQPRKKFALHEALQCKRAELQTLRQI